VSYRLIDHEPEGRTDKVSAMRGHSVAEARLPLLALFGHGEMSDLSPLSGVKRKSHFRDARSVVYRTSPLITYCVAMQASPPK
jgi:hypothetical protein